MPQRDFINVTALLTARYAKVMILQSHDFCITSNSKYLNRYFSTLSVEIRAINFLIKQITTLLLRKSFSWL